MLPTLLAAGPIMAISVAAHALTLANLDHSVHTLAILYQHARDLTHNGLGRSRGDVIHGGKRR